MRESESYRKEAARGKEGERERVEKLLQMSASWRESRPGTRPGTGPGAGQKPRQVWVKG